MVASPVSRQTIDTISHRIIDALTRLGYAYERKDGVQQRVRLGRRLITSSGAILLLEVDTERLPRGVRADQLTDERTLHHLTTVVHRPVRMLNTTGITYAVLLGAAVKPMPLPQKALLLEVLDQHPGTPFTFPVGAGPDGPIWKKLEGHYLVGGETGAGKSNWVISTVLALCWTNEPEDLEVVIIDPKGVDFLPLAGLPHVRQPIVTTVEEAQETIISLAAEIDRRRRKFLVTLSRDLETHNARAEDPLPRILVVIDEVTSLALSAGLKSPFYRHLIHLTSIGRAFGLHLILATQNPKAEVLNTLIRGNLAQRIAFQVATSTHSHMILGTGGAEKLPRIPGRMLARLGSGGTQQLQGYYLGEDDLADLPLQQDPLAFLDKDTRTMARYALDHLGGRFPQSQIMEAGWSRHAYRQAVNKLRQAGLLENREKNALYLVDGIFATAG